MKPLTTGNFERLWETAVVAEPPAPARSGPGEPLQPGRRQTYADGLRAAGEAVTELKARHAAEVAELKATVHRQTSELAQRQGLYEGEHARADGLAAQVQKLQSTIDQQAVRINELQQLYQRFRSLADDQAQQIINYRQAEEARSQQTVALAAICTPSRQTLTDRERRQREWDAVDLRGLAGAFS